MQPAKVASAAVYHNIHVKFWNQTNQGKLSISYQNSRTLSDERRTFFPASNRALGLSFLCLQKCSVVKKPQAGVHGKSSKVYYIGIEINEKKCLEHGGESAHVSFDLCDLIVV